VGATLLYGVERTAVKGFASRGEVRVSRLPLVDSGGKKKAEMPAEPETEVQLEIGHVLFIDIVGYSKALIDDQRALQQDLNDVVRNTEQFRAAESDGK